MALLSLHRHSGYSAPIARILIVLAEYDSEAGPQFCSHSSQPVVVTFLIEAVIADVILVFPRNTKGVAENELVNVTGIISIELNPPGEYADSDPAVIFTVISTDITCVLVEFLTMPLLSLTVRLPAVMISPSF